LGILTVRSCLFGSLRSRQLSVNVDIEGSRKGKFQRSPPARWGIPSALPRKDSDNGRARFTIYFSYFSYSLADPDANRDSHGVTSVAFFRLLLRVLSWPSGVLEGVQYIP
jgi:hypothetical protein